MSFKSVRKFLIIGAVVLLPLTVCSQFPGGEFPGGGGAFGEKCDARSRRDGQPLRSP